MRTARLASRTRPPASAQHRVVQGWANPQLPAFQKLGRLPTRHLDLRPFAVNDGERVWVVPGVPIPIAVGYYNKDYEDPPGLPAMGHGPGWREVLIDGDTRFDIELVRRVRRVAATP